MAIKKESVKVNEQEVKLKELVDSFTSAKRQADAFDKEAKALNTQIKSLMESLGKTSAKATSGEVVQYITQNRTSLDEDKLLQVLKENCPKTKAVVLKEVVDMDILESEIYHGKITKKAMKLLDGCKKVTPVTVLKITKKEK